MSTSGNPARRFRFLRLLRISLVLGATYDLVFAFLMMVAPTIPARLLHLPLPGEPYYLWLIAVFLVMLATLYLAAAREPQRLTAVILVAIVGRAAGAGVFFIAAAGRPELSGLLPLAFADLAFAVAHGAFWLPSRR